MLSVLARFVSTIGSYSGIGLLLFCVALALFFLVFAGKNWANALGAVVRGVGTMFSTPFVFLRNAFSIVGDARVAEKDYVGTREFVLFRYSRIAYLLVLIFALLYLSVGATAGILALYPKNELDQSNFLRSQINDTNTQLSSVATGTSPSVIADLQTKASSAQATYAAQTEADATLRQNFGFNGPAIGQIDSAADVSVLMAFKSNLPATFADCPLGPSWTNFTPDQCQLYQSRLLQYADGKIRELTLQQAYNAAKTQADNASQSEAQRADRAAQLKSSLADLQTQYDQVSVSGGRWIVPHVRLAASIILGVVLSLILYVWIAAILIDILNWLILMMRSLEKEHTRRLAADEAATP